MKRRTLRDKQSFRRTLNSQRGLWSGTSQHMLIRQRAWLGLCERDRRDPPHHYNLHIQPACGGLDYHNYHIRYLGIQEKHYTWSMVDAPYGREQSDRVYTYAQRHLFRDAIDITSILLVTDITNDIGDSMFWLPLIEYIPFVLHDLYRHKREKPAWTR